ncbi:transposase [Paenibacillus sp. J2TS4]|uniref:transposase n=1 Tax=Paenibacillus sp. J2TS4 TaxID=2807194 RepID=UPI001BD078B3|nr:transposase [Paenibacillus sp. J2TS4]
MYIFDANMDEESFRRHFKTKKACEQFLYKAKWPDGFSCPRCKHNLSYDIRSRNIPLYECRKCRHQTSLISGTVMEGSRTALYKWLFAFFLVSRVDRGTNAIQLSSLISVTYKTAWSMLHKIRHALTQADNKQPLTGIIQGGSARYRSLYNSSLNLLPEQSPVFVAASLNADHKPWQLKIKTISSHHINGPRILQRGINEFIDRHISTNESDDSDSIVQPKHIRIACTGSLRKYIQKARTWINRTFNGIGFKYLQSYLDEFCFRLNLQLQNTPIFNHLTNICMRTSAI